MAIFEHVTGNGSTPAGDADAAGPRLPTTLSTVRWCTLIGAAAGVVWAFQGIAGMFVVLLTAALGALVGLAVSRKVIDWRALLGERDDT